MLCTIGVEKKMDSLVGLKQHTPPDQQTTLEQQAAIQQEPTSDQFEELPPDQITRDGNEAYLRQHQRHLRSSYPSCDLSEISYHTELTDFPGFPGSRHSSLNTEPLTLDAEQIHDAKNTHTPESRRSSLNTEPLTLDADEIYDVKDQAVDILQEADTDAAFNIFTKDTLKTIIGRVSMMEYYWRHGQDLKIKGEAPLSPESDAKTLDDQISTLVDKAQQVVEANEQQSESKISVTAPEEKKRPEESGTSLEKDVNLKGD